MTCDSCQKHAENRLSGAYDMRCVHCMARLIRSARPYRKLQEGHVAALAFFHGVNLDARWQEVQKLLKEQA